MSVEPGFGGQQYIPSATNRIKALRKEIDRFRHTSLVKSESEPHMADLLGLREKRSFSFADLRSVEANPLVSRRQILLQVDGGINKETALRAKEAGADILVAGSVVFNSADYKAAINSLRRDF